MQVAGSIDENDVAGGKGWGGDWMRRTVWGGRREWHSGSLFWVGDVGGNKLTVWQDWLLGGGASQTGATPAWDANSLQGLEGVRSEGWSERMETRSLKWNGMASRRNEGSQLSGWRLKRLCVLWHRAIGWMVLLTDGCSYKGWEGMRFKDSRFKDSKIWGRSVFNLRELDSKIRDLKIQWFKRSCSTLVVCNVGFENWINMMLVVRANTILEKGGLKTGGSIEWPDHKAEWLL